MKKTTSIFAAMLAIGAVAISCQEKPEPTPAGPATVSAIPTIAQSGAAVKVSATNVQATDVVTLTAIAGTAYTADVTVSNVTENSFEIALPADLLKTRSYKLVLKRGEEVQFEGFLRPDDNWASMQYRFGAAMTGSNQLVADADVEGVTRHGYLDGNICELAEIDGRTEWRVWKGDADLSPLNIPGGNLNFADGDITDMSTLTNLKGVLDFSGVTGNLFLQCSSLQDLDMTMFPNATRLYAWWAGFKTINFGKVGVDKPCRLDFMNLNFCKNLTEVDLRNCLYLRDNNNGTDGSATFRECENLAKVELGHATGDANVDTDPILIIYGLDLYKTAMTEIDITNCGRLRHLNLEGCKMERIDLRNNALGEGKLWEGGELDGQPVYGRPDGWFPYLYILKSPAKICIEWASAAEAKGERWLKVENYWATNYSAGNAGETGPETTNWPTGWVNENPAATAKAAGIPVTYYTYWNEDSNPVPHEVAK